MLFVIPNCGLLCSVPFSMDSMGLTDRFDRLLTVVGHVDEGTEGYLAAGTLSRGMLIG